MFQQHVVGKTHNACPNNGKTRRGRKYNPGGMLHGPTHEQGGIPATVGGNTPIELEGGEYIINAQTVNAVGEGFLNKLNSTATTYHTGGFNQGQLPSPSTYANGGKVPNRRNKMRRGGRPVGRKPMRRTRSVSRGRKMVRGGALRRGASPMTRRTVTRPMGTRRYNSGGGVQAIQFKNPNPCPNAGSIKYDYTHFLQGNTGVDGSITYYCCQSEWLNSECEKISGFSHIRDLIHF